MRQIWIANFLLMLGLLLIFGLSACSFNPVVDLRASDKQAQLYQRDLMECRELAKQIDFSIFPQNHKAVIKCLEGRGHSVLNNVNQGGGILF